MEFLSLKGGFTGSSESTLVKKPHCWKSHVAARLVCMQVNQLWLNVGQWKPVLGIEDIKCLAHAAHNVMPLVGLKLETFGSQVKHTATEPTYPFSVCVN